MPASNGPRFWGLSQAERLPRPLWHWLTSVYDLNLSHAANSVAPNIEMEAISMLRDLFGLPASFLWTFVSGATMANFSGLAIAVNGLGNNTAGPFRRMDFRPLPFVKVLSCEAHSSSFKHWECLGWGGIPERRSQTFRKPRSDERWSSCEKCWRK